MVSNIIGIREYILKHTYIPKAFMGNSVRFSMDSNRGNKLLGIVVKDSVTFHSGGQVSKWKCSWHGFEWDT